MTELGPYTVDVGVAYGTALVLRIFLPRSKVTAGLTPWPGAYTNNLTTQLLYAWFVP